ncbi:hypothetical protein DC31_00360 [Microbacterium sp. CH12i]|uniref:hypothetical protein n=1 Tax=Microbacterium sp. CH12i TaxID=1479651 RepID=UPI000461E348|nr:hypothetical protein [Microbacterium sp. CH12i]KDA07201.1 hypothetical protein DC31_00360 [Microbacterium sp. CH12i]
MNWRGLSSTAAVVAVGFALVACTAAPLPIEDAQTPRPTASATSNPTPAPTLSPDIEPVADPGPCEGATPAYPIGDETEVEQLGGVSLAVPFDRGPMTHAAGEAILNDQGIPVAYTVADNDTISVVGARFCVGEQWLYWTNYVRRDGDALFVGDTLNLDAHTILSVGDQNGVVHDNALPEGFVIPPQR